MALDIPRVGSALSRFFSPLASKNLGTQSLSTQKSNTDSATENQNKKLHGKEEKSDQEKRDKNRKQGGGDDFQRESPPNLFKLGKKKKTVEEEKVAKPASPPPLPQEALQQHYVNEDPSDAYHDGQEGLSPGLSLDDLVRQENEAREAAALAAQKPKFIDESESVSHSYITLFSMLKDSQGSLTTGSANIAYKRGEKTKKKSKIRKGIMVNEVID